VTYQLVGERILCGAARFSALSNGVVRLEWSAKGQFEDNPTVTVLTRPEAIPFTNITLTDEGVLHLHTELMQIVYQPSDEPFNEANLQIHWACGTESGTWTPSTVDTENLGGTVASLDLIHRNFQPKGVHPASVSQKYPYTNEWLYTPLKAAHRHLRDRGETTRFEEPPLWYLDAYRHDDLPESVQECLKQWHHFPPGVLSLVVLAFLMIQPAPQLRIAGLPNVPTRIVKIGTSLPMVETTHRLFLTLYNCMGVFPCCRVGHLVSGSRSMTKCTMTTTANSLNALMN
jgi:hypothetical protein